MDLLHQISQIVIVEDLGLRTTVEQLLHHAQAAFEALQGLFGG